MPAELATLLQRHFSHRAFRPGQEEVLQRVLSGENTLALFPTGGGKSLCYQLPALALDGPVIVISPLLALMRDQVDTLTRQGIPALRLDSTLTEEETSEAEQAIASGWAQLIFLSPERLAAPATFSLLAATAPALVAIDEAHCFSEWGQSFRPDYRRLPKLVKRLKPRAVLALTATATRAVARDIRKGFRILTKNQIQLTYARPNLSWTVHYATDTQEKRSALLRDIQSPERLPAIVYCTRQLTTEHIASFLTQNGIPSKAFNAGIPTDVRGNLLRDYLDGKIPVIVATIAFGMGVDKPDVRSVIHYDLPRSPEGWVQESGRAGRDGKPAHTAVIASAPDIIQHQNMTFATQPSAAAVASLLRSLFTGAKQVMLSPYALTTQLDISRQVLDTILTYLEDERVIAFHSLHHRKVRIQPIRPIPEIRENLPKKSPLHTILGVFGWHDLGALASTLPDYTKLTKSLLDLELAGDAIIRRSHQLHTYTIRQTPDSLSALVERFTTHFQTHTQNELTRIAAVERILTSRKCIHSSLLHHLDEKRSPPCGRCSRCLKQPLKSKLPGKVPPVDDDSLDQLRTFARSLPPQLRTPRQLTRYLLGINSPATWAARLTKGTEYGLLEGHSWDQVEAISRTHI